MGIDPLDVSFRIEKQFGVYPGPEDWTRLAMRHEPPDMTAGELHDMICDLCRAADKPVPYSSWSRLKLLLVAALGVNPSDIRKDAWLIRDLGMD